MPYRLGWNIRGQQMSSQQGKLSDRATGSSAGCLHVRATQARMHANIYKVVPTCCNLQYDIAAYTLCSLGGSALAVHVWPCVPHVCIHSTHAPYRTFTHCSSCCSWPCCSFRAPIPALRCTANTCFCSRSVYELCDTAPHWVSLSTCDG